MSTNLQLGSTGSTFGDATYQIWQPVNPAAFFMAESIYLSDIGLTSVLPAKEENMETIRLSNKGQIVIPNQVRAAHGWEPGLELIVEDTGGGIKLKPMTPYVETKAEELLGCVGYQGPKKSLKEMEAAIAKGARKKL